MSDNNWNGEGKPSVGQMVLIRNDGEKPVEVVVISGYQLCTRTNSGFLQMHNKNDMLPIPTPEQKAKQKAIDELSKLFGDCLTDIEAAEAMISYGYTKAKVKPLPKDWWELYKLSSYLYSSTYLIANGYCIGGQE